MMNKLRCIMALLLTLFILAGCGSQVETLGTEAPVPAVSVSESEHSHTLYFPDDVPFAYSHDISPDGPVYFHEVIKTNTTEITVKNTGTIPFTCNLHFPDDYEDVIGTFTLEPGEKNAFSNLISIENYCISFQSSQSGTIDADISG